MRFTVVTILPELIQPAFAAGVVGRARDAEVIHVDVVNPRDFTTDKHRTVDDTPYGGGPGMVMKPEPLLAALGEAAAWATAAGAKQLRRIALTPSGAPLTQATVRRLATYDQLILLCGRYEGMDQRVLDVGIDEELSIGDYVLSGGELAALVVIDAVARLVPGVLGASESAEDESFSQALLEYPHYTRPAVLAHGTQRLEVPPALLSGNHAAIARWRREQAMARTVVRRPELWAQHVCTPADATWMRLEPRANVAARTYVALVHHPVFDKQGKVVTSALTNLDLHDIARSTTTYGLAGYFVVTPVSSQREKAEHIGAMWREAEFGDHRASALAAVRSVASVEAAITELTDAHGVAPYVVATSANPESFPGCARLDGRGFASHLQAQPTRPILLLFGTGWGMVDTAIPGVEAVLAPIKGRPNWNHLSVRSAVAITLDRLFGLADRVF